MLLRHTAQLLYKLYDTCHYVFKEGTSLRPTSVRSEFVAGSNSWNVIGTPN